MVDRDGLTGLTDRRRPFRPGHGRIRPPTIEAASLCRVGATWPQTRRVMAMVECPRRSSSPLDLDVGPAKLEAGDLLAPVLGAIGLGRQLPSRQWTGWTAHFPGRPFSSTTR